MRLTRAGEYAIRCIAYLSRKGTGVSVSKRELVAKVDIPASFLAKIVQDLSKGGLIEITQGAKGGYRLLKAPHEITLLYVVEIMIGRIYLNDCVNKRATCSSVKTCLVHLVWDKASAQLRETLASVTFAELIQDKSYSSLHGL